MNEVIEALRVGDRDKAFHLLRQHLTANPRDANGWVWMSEATTEPHQQRDALRRVLRLAPDHPRAASFRKRLERIEAQLAPPAPPPAATLPAPVSPPGEPTVPIEAAPPAPPAPAEDDVDLAFLSEETTSAASPSETQRPKKDTRGTSLSTHDEGGESVVDSLQREPSAVASAPAGSAPTAAPVSDDQFLDFLLTGRDQEAAPAPAEPSRPAASRLSAARPTRDESLSDLRASLGMGGAQAVDAPPPVGERPPPILSAPAPRPVPQASPPERIPSWVWIVMVLAVVIVVAFLFFLFQNL